MSGKVIRRCGEEMRMATRTNRTERLDLHLTAQAKRALQSAAEASHKTLNDFVLESALARAHSVLAERQVFRLNAERWAAFLAALDAQAEAAPRQASRRAEHCRLISGARRTSSLRSSSSPRPMPLKHSSAALNLSMLTSNATRFLAKDEAARRFL
jgi:uncharacterized protein (DUF1778 family)